MMTSAIRIFACLAVLASAGCQTSQQKPQSSANPMLTNAGFVAKRATTPEQNVVLASLPANRLVRQTVNGKTTYLLADPSCGCVHVGSQTAFQNFKGMQNTVFEMNRFQLDPGLDSGNIGNLDSWSPL